MPCSIYLEDFDSKGTASDIVEANCMVMEAVFKIYHSLIRQGNQQY